MIENNQKITVCGEVKEITAGTTYEDLAKEFQSKFKFPILVAKQNSVFKELSAPVQPTGEVEFFDLLSGQGNRVYLNGLMYLTIYAIKELYGNATKVNVKYTIDKGLYIECSKKLDKDVIKNIKKKMEEIVEQDMNISKKNVSRIEAIEYFKKNNDIDKATMLRYNTNNYIKLYKLGNMYDYYFSKLPISTGVLKLFDITYLNENGFILLYPDRYNDGIVPKYTHHPQRFEVYNEYKDWLKIMNISNVSSLNEIVSSGHIGNLMRIDETIQDSRLLNIARDIWEHKDKLKIILIAGPSSSGKTTTSIKLVNYLKTFGMNPVQLSMDDYFVPRVKNPKKEDGSYDYECLEALDLKLLDSNIEKLLAGEKIMAPVYNFIKGEPEFTKELELGKNDIIVMEGIHALNPKLLPSIPRSKKFKMYISPLTALNIDNHNRISTSDNRLLRRIVRDNRTRGHKVETTLSAWSNVRLGEEKYIFPYQDEANVTFNTALIYELGVLKTYAEPLLYSVDIDSPYYAEAKRLINLLKTFLPMPSEDIPDDSLIREFIGGSCFKVM